MAYQMAATAVTLNDLEGHLQVAGLFKCNPSNISAAFYTISTDSVLARFPCISRAFCDSFGRKMAKRLKLCKVHSFSTSSNLRHYTTVLNADVPNCHATLKVVIYKCGFTGICHCT